MSLLRRMQGDGSLTIQLTGRGGARVRIKIRDALGRPPSRQRLDVIKKPRLLEELGGISEFKTFKLEQILYFGQLAEDDLSQARGACATYSIKVVLYKPRIPW